MPVLIGFPYCAATSRLRSKLPTSTLTTTNSLATSSAFLVFFSEASSARQSSHQLAPKITSTERFVVPAVARACSMSVFAFAASLYGSPAAIAPLARTRIAVERTRWICMMAPSRGEWLSVLMSGFPFSSERFGILLLCRRQARQKSLFVSAPLCARPSRLSCWAARHHFEGLMHAFAEAGTQPSVQTASPYVFNA